MIVLAPTVTPISRYRNSLFAELPFFKLYSVGEWDGFRFAMLVQWNGVPVGTWAFDRSTLAVGRRGA